MRRSVIGFALVALSALTAACAKTPAAQPKATSLSASGTATPAQEAAVGVESNPPGDIPDNQAFVAYRSDAGHFAVKVPEGWAHTSSASAETFTDKLNTIVLSWSSASSAPTPQSVQRDDVARLRAQRHAFQLVGIRSVLLRAGGAVLMTFRENSAPNDVTGRQYRDDVLRYALYRSGVEIVVELSSPVGADNVDPWRTITESLRWT